MVSKLQLAVGENITLAIDKQSPAEVINNLKDHYLEIKEGIGVHKNPALYGAFPTDPYSHTPSMYGAQQPGMTGQVKEDIISRVVELGIVIKNGTIHIVPELIMEPKPEEQQTIFLSFTFCGVPFRYKRGEENKITILLTNGEEMVQEDMTISQNLSAELFSRSDIIQKINVELQKTVP